MTVYTDQILPIIEKIVLLITVENHWSPKEAENKKMQRFVWHYLTNLSMIEFMIYYGGFRAIQSEKYADQESWWNVINSHDVGDVSKQQALALKEKKNLAFRMLIKNPQTGKISVLLG